MTRRTLTHRTREEWLASRRIGASDVAKVLGISQWGGPWDVWRRLTHPAPASSATASQSRGHTWEPVVLDLYRDQADLEVKRPPPFTIWAGPEEWASVTPDAFAMDRKLPVELRLGLAEAKTDVHFELWGDPCEIERWTPECAAIVRPDYAVQGYTQLHGTDQPWVDLAVLLPYYELRVFRLWRDPEVEAQLVEVLTPWWERHVKGGEPPEADGTSACNAWWAEKFAWRDSSQMIDPDDELRELCIRKAQLDALYKAAKDERDDVNARIIARVGEAYGITLGPAVGRKQPKAVVIRNQGRETFDTRALLAAHPELKEVVARYARRSDPYAYVRFYHFNPENPQGETP